jgi:hypothetical protein
MGKAKNEILDHFTNYAIQETFFLIKLFYYVLDFSSSFNFKFSWKNLAKVSFGY